MSYYKREGNFKSKCVSDNVVNITWNKMWTPNTYRVWPKPHLIGVVKDHNWRAKNLLTKQSLEGSEASLVLAKRAAIQALVQLNG